MSSSVGGGGGGATVAVAALMPFSFNRKQFFSDRLLVGGLLQFRQQFFHNFCSADGRWW